MRHRGAAGAVSSAVLLLIAVGCHPEARVAQSSFRDSLGLHISLTDLQDSSLIPSCGVGAEPTLQIGTQGGDTAQELYGATDATRLSDGRILVLNSGSHDVRVFDVDGRLLARLGREGDGPGEFRNPVKLGVLPGDSVAVWDPGLRRVSVLDVNGRGVREVNLSGSLAYPTAQFAILDDDFVIGSQLHRPAEGLELVQQGLLLLRYSRTGVLVDTLTTLANGKAGWVTAGGARRFGPPLFNSRALFASNGTLVYATGGLESSVVALDPAGKAIAAVRWQPPDLRVTDADLRTFREDRLKGADAATQDRLKEWLAAMPVASTFPSSDGILVGNEGGLWVKTYQRPGSDTQTWLSFAPDGQFLCSASFSDRFTALEFADKWVLGVRLGDLDVEYVEVWPLGGD